MQKRLQEVIKAIPGTNAASKSPTRKRQTMNPAKEEAAGMQMVGMDHSNLLRAYVSTIDIQRSMQISAELTSSQA